LCETEARRRRVGVAQLMPEGCLSVRWLYGDVERSTQATVTAYDEHGESFVRGASGLLAQIFQHEIDHLDGILFIDKAHNLEEVTPEKNHEY
jgi:peptide deformylase